ncbi:melanocortin receptor 5-like [Actinia tenebrosa]|uniref:Melanocortin receptor 5-like n=1 Tax=Actinia tenebrosa TaxID=6105 RepID=A0A6P8J5M7_ACTTE|nr:melanocortin receptor 5-like [Actinia tenebrosa]
MALLASSLNFLTIFTFVKTSSLREKPSNVLVLGLAIADFSAGVIAQPAFVSWNIYIFLSSDDKLETTQEIVLRVFHSISNVILLVSFLNIIAITADRFLAVYLHLRYQELVTTKRCGIALACIWVFCLAFNVATSSLMLVSYEGYIVFLTLYIALGVINIFLLVKISRVIRRHSVQIQAQQQSLQQSIDMPRYKKSVKTMTPSVQALSSSVLVLGLAVSDLLVDAVVQPLFCVVKYAELKFGKNADVSQTIGKVFHLMSYQLVSVSFLTLSAITADRFLAVHLHLRYQELVT